MPFLISGIVSFALATFVGVRRRLYVDLWAHASQAFAVEDDYGNTAWAFPENDPQSQPSPNRVAPLHWPPDEEKTEFRIKYTLAASAGSVWAAFAAQLNFPDGHVWWLWTLAARWILAELLGILLFFLVVWLDRSGTNL